MSLLDIVRQHRASACEESELSEERVVGGLNSLSSLNLQPQPVERPEPDRCLEWLIRFVRGRYPKVTDVRSAALNAGFSRNAVQAGLNSNEFVTYKPFRLRYVGEVEHIRTVDDWLDDPPLNGR